MKNDNDKVEVLTVEDQAWAWIVRLDGDEEPSHEDIQALHRWMAESPEHHHTFKRLSQHWDELDTLSALAVPQEQQASRSMGMRYFMLWLLAPVLLLFGVVQQSLAASVEYPRRVAAAGAVMALVVSVFIWQSPGGASGTYVTQVGEQAQYTLPDGSTLWLNTNSEVSVAYGEQRRLITLTKGEAHFDVKPDKARPFEVYAGTRFVRAVGTAFTVYLDREQVEVTVSEGKVALGLTSTDEAEDKNRQDVVAEPLASADVLGSLEAGQSVIIPPGPAGVMDEITELEKGNLKRRLAWMEGQLIYAGESLEEVLKEVSRYTPVYIELTDPALKAIRIGGQFKVGETEALLRVLEVGFNLKVSRLSEHHVQIHAPSE